MATERAQTDTRVLLLAPTARDAQASQRLFVFAGIECVPCTDLVHLCNEAKVGAAALIIPEEVVLTDDADLLERCVREQPVWSDLPVILLSRAGAESPAVGKALATLGNVSLIERPVRVSTLLSVIRAALRARERQYQARDYFAERQRAEDAAREARDAAQAANAAKDQFLAVLSHELRTPLSPVVMTISAMEEDPALPAQFRDDVAMIRRNVDLETKLIDDLLDLSRVASGKLRLRVESASVHDILQHVLQVCRTDLRERKLHIATELNATDHRVTGDPARLQQVFWNLVKNAIKFTPEGGEIVLSTSNPRPGRLRVNVVDRGAGIPADVLPRLFNAFEQGNPNVTRQFGGLGLGLAICKAIVEVHGGSITARSAGGGQGATFTVELDTATAEPAREASPATTPERSGGERLPRLLLVEDHVDTARTLTRLLVGAGYDVRTANTAAGALALADAERFDIVVSDIGLPDTSGYELMERLRARHHLKGIAVSGYGMEADMQRSREAGFADHIVKPVKVAHLESVIRRVAAEPTQA